MGDVYFVQTDWYRNGGYRSHVDFWRLVELSDYPVIPLSQLDPDSNNTYIITPVNGEWQQGWRNPRARIILYALEWNIDGEHNVPPGVAEVWCGDKWHSEKHGYRYVPLGSHPGLNVESAHKPQRPLYDVALMMYRDPPRRAKMIANMRQQGLGIAPDGWGVDRSLTLIQSHCMVAIHQWDNLPVLPPLRMCIAAAHCLPVITEQVADRGVFSYQYLLQSNYASLANTARLMTQYSTRDLGEIGQALYDFLCVDFTFRQSIEAVL